VAEGWRVSPEQVQQERVGGVEAAALLIDNPLALVVEVASLARLELARRERSRFLDTLGQQHDALWEELAGLDFEADVVFGLEIRAGWWRHGHRVLAGRDVL